MGLAWVFFHNALQVLTLKHRALLSEEEWTFVLAEFQRGKSHLHYVLHLKLDNWQGLPWLLCKLVFRDPRVARQGAREVIDKYQACPADAVHHRLTLKFCVGTLRSQLDLFLGGAELRTLPEVHVEVSKLQFIPLAERAIERPHSKTRRELEFKHHGPLSVTMAQRAYLVHEYCSSEDAFLHYCSFATKAYDTRQIAGLLGLSRHPWLRELCSRNEYVQTHT